MFAPTRRCHPSSPLGVVMPGVSPPSLVKRPLPAWFAAMVLGLVTGANSSAQELPSAPTLHQAISSGWMEFSVVAGRITVAGSRIGNYTTTSNTGGRKEQLSVNVRQGRFAISYRLDGPDEDFSVELIDGQQFLIRRVPGADSDLTAVEFTQRSGEPLRLTIGMEPSAHVFEGPSLWHLLIAHGELCEQHLVPLLELLRPDWQLMATARRAEEALLRLAVGRETPNRQRWQALVEQLASDRFSQREAADRQLRSVGPMVVAFLKQLPDDELDAEQQFRIRRIIRALAERQDDDAVGQVVAWLAVDPEIWLVLMQRPEESVRRLAGKQMEVVLGQSIQFDPEADEAERSEQIEQLRQQLHGVR